MFRCKKNCNPEAPRIRPQYICFVCGKEVKDIDEFEWHGYDGDKIHKKCEPFIQRKYECINNMSDKEFKDYIQGID